MIPKFVKIEVMFLKVQLLQVCIFFSLYFAHYFVYYFRINLADKIVLGHICFTGFK